MELDTIDDQYQMHDFYVRLFPESCANGGRPRRDGANHWHNARETLLDAEPPDRVIAS